MYVAPADLAERPGPTELAQVATPERDAIVDAALMDATLRDTDRSAWSADEIAVADAALARINQAIGDADAEIDGFLAVRYTVPVDNTKYPIVRVWATAITRYLLHKDRSAMESNDPIVRDYKDALRLLQLAAQGKFMLGADAPTTGSADPDFRPGKAMFDDCALDQYSHRGGA